MYIVSELCCTAVPAEFQFGRDVSVLSRGRLDADRHLQLDWAEFHGCRVVGGALTFTFFPNTMRCMVLVVKMLIHGFWVFAMQTCR